jgi:hypothetical protein
MKTTIMTKAAVMFNGIRFPFTVIDRAFEWCKKEKGLLLGVFLLAEDADPEGYIFPSDIDAAEDITDSDDSVSDNEKVVESHIKMLKNRATAAQIKFESIVLHDPEEDLLSETLKGCNYIFVAGDIDELSSGTTESVDLNKWLENFSGTVEKIP